MKLVYFLCLLVILNACVKISDKEADPVVASVSTPTSTVQQVDQAQPSPSQQPQVRAMQGAHHYQVLLPMPSEGQIVQRSIKASDALPVPLPMKLSDGIFIDEHPKSDQTYVYEIGMVREGSFEILATYEVHIPRDVVIDAEHIFTKNEPLRTDGRLFFTPTGILTTNGFTVLIEAQSLISNQGLIRTFPPGHQAVHGLVAKGGGQIRMSFRTASGDLKVEMRGQRGASGVKGLDLPQNAPNGGAPGGPAGCGGCGFYLRRQGNAGGAGGSGFAGGSSGNFELEIFEAHQLALHSEINAGEGGSGGIGGLGEPDTSFVIQGPVGPTGASGTAGDREFSYIKDLSGRRIL
ncbi:MAG: hypothetical protein ACXWC9_06585 [Pseudobdellovibrionaceae bacterium]